MSLKDAHSHVVSSGIPNYASLKVCGVSKVLDLIWGDSWVRHVTAGYGWELRATLRCSNLTIFLQISNSLLLHQLPCSRSVITAKDSQSNDLQVFERSRWSLVLTKIHRIIEPTTKKAPEPTKTRSCCLAEVLQARLVCHVGVDPVHLPFPPVALWEPLNVVTRLQNIDSRFYRYLYILYPVLNILISRSPRLTWAQLTFGLIRYSCPKDRLSRAKIAPASI